MGDEDGDLAVAPGVDLAHPVHLLFVTTPDAAVARSLARALVEERLAACGNIVPAIASVFRWQGTVQEETEALLILKTSSARVAELCARVVELHPYDVPEVLSLGVDDGHGEYLDWLGECIAPGGRSNGTQA